MRQQHLWLRREQQSLIENAPIQRLFAKAISRNEKPSPPIIPQREREHAVEMLHHLIAVLFVKVRQDFGVGSAAKGMTAGLKISAQFSVVVNLAVENDGDAFVFVINRLLASDEIDDRQAPHTEIGR